MSSRFLAILFTIPLVGLAVLAVTARPVTPPAPATTPARPSVGIWRVVCPPSGWGWGPFTSPDACRSRLESAQQTCARPLLEPHSPNPDFVALAPLCRDALNASLCSCDFQLVVARVPTAGEFLASPPTPTAVLFGRP
jgi:hypothetical protein